jgi:hypothetical protein
MEFFIHLAEEKSNYHELLNNEVTFYLFNK